MKNLVKIILFIVITAFIINYFNKNLKPAKTDQAPRTLLKIYNGSCDTVFGYITLGATPGCLQNVVAIPFINDSITGQRGLQGYFKLLPNDSTIAWAPDSLGYNGVISFNYPPNNCPAPTYTNGINQFEFIVNNAYQGTNAQESINISCVHGVNCVIRVNAVTTNPFNAGPTFNNVQSFANTLDRSQTNIAGVYPYGCDTCTGSKSPPNCIPLPQPKCTNSTCQVQRNAAQNGGIIKIIYMAQEIPLK